MDKELENGQLERLVERHYGMVHAIAYGRLRDREAAEDLAQEVFLRACLSWDRIAASAQLAGWLVRVAHNLATDWERRGTRTSRLVHMVSIEELHEQIADEGCVDARAMMPQREQEQIVHDAILRLPAGQREVVLLRYAEGLCQREIARRLGVHPSTVGRQLKQALSSMRGCAGRTLREAAPSLRPSRGAVVRAVMLTSAVAALGTEAKAALAAAAGGVTWPASLAATSPSPVGLFSFQMSGVFPVLCAGGKLMLSGKVITGILTVFALAGSGALLHNSNAGAGTPGGLPGRNAIVTSAAQGAPMAVRPAAVPVGSTGATARGTAASSSPGPAAAPASAQTIKALVGRRIYCAVCGKLLEDAVTIRVPAADRDKYRDDGVSDNGIAHDGVPGNVLVVRDQYIGPECRATKDRLVNAIRSAEKLRLIDYCGRDTVALDSTADGTAMPALLAKESQRDEMLRAWNDKFLANYRDDKNDPRSAYYAVHVPNPPALPRYPAPASYISPQQKSAAAAKSNSSVVALGAAPVRMPAGVAVAGTGAVAAVRSAKH